jgi:hypothetical protein
MNSKIVSIRGTLRLAAVLVLTSTLLAPQANAIERYPDRGRGGLAGRLLGILNQVDAKFGRRAIVVSGCRSRAHNRRIGGARESYHLRCMAADIYVPGVGKYTLWRYLFTHPTRGGLGNYCRSFFVHVDTGPRREWTWGCGRKAKRKVRRR